MNEYKKIEKEINEALEKKQKKENEIATAINTANAKIKEQEVARQNALSADDEKAFIAALEELNKQKGKLQFYQEKAEQKTEELSGEDLKRLINEIRKQQKTIFLNACEQNLQVLNAAVLDMNNAADAINKGKELAGKMASFKSFPGSPEYSVYNDLIGIIRRYAFDISRTAEAMKKTFEYQKNV